MIKGVKESS